MRFIRFIFGVVLLLKVCYTTQAASSDGLRAVGLNTLRGTSNFVALGSSTGIGFDFYNNREIGVNFNGAPITRWTNNVFLIDPSWALGFGTDTGPGMGPTISYNPAHSLDPEFQFSSGNSFGFGAGVGLQGKSVFQFGSARATHEILYLPADIAPGTADATGEGWNSNFGPSKTLVLQSGYYSNSTAFMPQTAIRSETLDTSGTTELRFYNPDTQNLRQTNSPAIGTEQFAITTTGVRIDKGLFRTVVTPESVNTSFNIAYTNAVDIVNPISTALAFTDTMPFASNGLTVSKDVFVYAGIDNRTNFTFPSWQWLNAVPTGLASNSFAKLHLDVNGTNDASVVATWTPGTYSPNIDTNASNFFLAASITNVWERSAIIQLVSDLKHHICANGKSEWTNLFALYPHVGTTSTSQSYNLIQTNIYQITWHGTPTFNTNGVTGDGSAAWGDTGIVDSTAPWTSSSALLWAWVRAPQAPTDNGAFIGVNFNGSTFTHIGRSGAGIRSDGPFHTDGSADGLLIPGDWRGFAGLLRYGSGANSQQTYINSLATGGPNGAFSSFAGTDVLLLDDTTGFSNANLANSGCGTGFVVADMPQLIADLQAFNAALNR